MASERTSHLTQDLPKSVGREGKAQIGWERGKGGEREKEGERRNLRERSSTFSLEFLAIRPAVSSGARGKVYPRYKSFA